MQHMADKNHRRVELSRIASRCRAFSNSCHLFIAGFQCHAIQIDQNQNQNRSIDKVQNPRNERRYIYKEPRQDSGQRIFRIRDIRRNVLPKLIRICMETPCWCSPR